MVSREGDCVTIRIAYFEARPGKKDTDSNYDVELADGESIVSVEQVLDGGYNTDWHRVYISSPNENSNG